MAQRIRVPGLVDLVLVADPSEIRALNEEPRLDRRFLPRGPLVNRLIAGRIRRWFQIKGQPLPSLAPRGDPVRAERQRELAIALDPADGRALWSEQQLDKLASFVRGVGTRDGAAITVQEIVGRLFDPLYAANPESWRAATLIDRFREGFSLVQIIWLITGRLRRARALLVERASQNRWAMHGTAIGCMESCRRWSECGNFGRSRTRHRLATTPCSAVVSPRPRRSQEPSRRVSRRLSSPEKCRLARSSC